MSPYRTVLIILTVLLLIFSFKLVSFLFILGTVFVGLLVVHPLPNIWFLWVTLFPTLLLWRHGLAPVGMLVTAVMVAAAVFGPGVLRQPYETEIEPAPPEVPARRVEDMRSVELRYPSGETLAVRGRSGRTFNVRRCDQICVGILYGGQVDWLRIQVGSREPVKLVVDRGNDGGLMSVPDDGADADIVVIEDNAPVVKSTDAHFEIWSGLTLQRDRMILDQRGSETDAGDVILFRYHAVYTGVADIAYLRPDWNAGSLEGHAWDWASVQFVRGTPDWPGLRDDLEAVGVKTGRRPAGMNRRKMLERVRWPPPRSVH